MQAVQVLAASVGKLKAGDEAPAPIPDFAGLLANVEFLQAEVARAMVAAKSERPRRYVWDLLRTARKVCAATAVAVAGASAQTGAQGGDFRGPVIFTALGTAVATSVAELFATLSHHAISVTPAAQFKALHRQLIEALGEFLDMLPWLDSPANRPGVLDTVEKVRLGTVFLVSNLDQLAVKLLQKGQRSYRELLDSVRSSLDSVHLLTTGHPQQNLADICALLAGLRLGLEEKTIRVDNPPTTTRRQ